jgi:hypothetical protein
MRERRKYYLPAKCSSCFGSRLPRGEAIYCIHVSNELCACDDQLMQGQSCAHMQGRSRAYAVMEQPHVQAGQSPLSGKMQSSAM